jgi:hypothetical protein
MNWPLHRGTATAFPLAAFGLSAVFFTTLSHIFLGDDVGEYLLLLAIGTVALTFGSFFFVTVPHADQYLALSQSDRVRRDSNPLHRQRPAWKPSSKGSKDPQVAAEPSKYPPFLSFAQPATHTKNSCQQAVKPQSKMRSHSLRQALRRHGGRSATLLPAARQSLCSQMSPPYLETSSIPNPISTARTHT